MSFLLDFLPIVIYVLDGLFHIIDTTTDKIVLVTDKVVEGITSTVANLFSSKKKNKKEITKKDEE